MLYKPPWTKSFIKILTSCDWQEGRVSPRRQGAAGPGDPSELEGWRPGVAQGLWPQSHLPWRVQRSAALYLSLWQDSRRLAGGSDTFRLPFPHVRLASQWLALNGAQYTRAS